MKLATTTGDFYRYAKSYCESIEAAAAAGFRYLDFCVSFPPYFEENLLGDDWKREMEKIKDCAKRLGVTFIQSHAYSSSNLLEPGIDKADRLHKIHRSIEISGALGIPNMVLHGQLAIEFNKEQFFEANRSFLKTLQPMLEENGVNVLIENGPRKHLTVNRLLKEKVENPAPIWGFTDATVMKEFLEYAALPYVHACWDTGHRNMDGSQYDQLMILGKELYGLHVHDNSGELDEHLAPYFGSMNWDDLMNGLLDCGYQGYFTYEGDNALGCDIGKRRHARRPFERDDRLARLPLSLRIEMEAFMYHVGEHMLKAYDCFEE